MYLHTDVVGVLLIISCLLRCTPFPNDTLIVEPHFDSLISTLLDPLLQPLYPLGADIGLELPLDSGCGLLHFELKLG